MHELMIEQFERGGDRLRAACDGLTEPELRAAPGPGEWSTHQVVVHMADMDAVAIDRMKRVLAEDNPTLLDADEDAYAKRLHYHAQSLEGAFRLFEIGRSQWAMVLRNLPEEAWARIGTHNVAGQFTLLDLLKRYTDHLEHHLWFVLEKRSRLGKSIDMPLLDYWGPGFVEG